MNIAYTFKLKHVAIIDVLHYCIRICAQSFRGGYATGIVVSQWAILLTFVLALVLAIGKRRGELINAEISGKPEKHLMAITYNLQILPFLFR